jgi:hypothetical protein
MNDNIRNIEDYRGRIVTESDILTLLAVGWDANQRGTLFEKTASGCRVYWNYLLGWNHVEIRKDLQRGAGRARRVARVRR